MKFVIKICLSTLLPVILSCKEDDRTNTACGCNGPADKQIVNAMVQYLGGGRFNIQPITVDGVPLQALATACSVNGGWIVSTEISKPNYVISGNTKLSCQPGYSSYIGPTEIEITKITKMP